MNAKQIWHSALERIQTRVNNQATFNAWFKSTSGIALQEGTFVIGVPTTFVKEQLERRFCDVVRSSLSETLNTSVQVRFIVPTSTHKTANSTFSGEEYGEIPNEVGAHSIFARYNGEASVAAGYDAELQNEGWTENPVSQKIPSNISEAALVAATSERISSQGSTSRGITGRSTTFPRNDLTRPRSYGNKNSRGSSIGRTSRDTQYKQHETERYTGSEDQHSGGNLSSNTEQKLWPASGESILNPRYTFSTFIVGKANRLAHAASLAVSESPGQTYNPLFLYGGVGLGKTHLLHAIGHVGEAAGLNVLYVSSEKFTNEIINAIRYQKTEEFRAKYRQIDILMVDDIQFIAGKESTEEEFFHTFNTLHTANKQIVISSDRPPKAIHSLQDRLRSRFEWGLLADIQPPEYEHRLAILRSKSESLRFAIPPAVIEYIARPEVTSVRELEGALNRVIAYAMLHDAPLSVGLATQALEHIYQDGKGRPLSMSEVLETVAQYYNMGLDALKGKQRDKEIVWPRQVAMYLMREETTASLLQVGTELGGRDHTTVMHGWDKVNSEIKTDDRVRREIAAIREMLRSSRR